MKKLILITLVPLTLLIEGSNLIVMEKGEPLKKIEYISENTESNENTPISEVPDHKQLGKMIFEIDFNKHPIGTYSSAMFKQDFYNYEGENLHYENHTGKMMMGVTGPGETLSIIKDGNDKVLRVLYKKNKFGLGTWKEPQTYTGFQQLSALPKNNRPKEDVNNPQEVTLIYYVKFESDFEWVIGGKLPGLAGGISPGGSARIGSERLNNGFSARFMWHMVNDNPTIITYIYHPGREGKIGQFVHGAGAYLSSTHVPREFGARDKNNGLTIKRNIWYKIQQTIKANTPLKSDGTMKVWLNDKLVADFGDMKYIGDGKHGKYSVDRLLFSTFYGGGDKSYAPKKNTHIRFKNLKIYVK